MPSLSEKRQARVQRKKQQLAALLTLTKLNKMDKLDKKKVTDFDGVEMPEPNPKRFRCNEDDQIEMIAAGKQQMSDDQFKDLKRVVNEERKKKPSFRLRDGGDMASLSVHNELRLPICLADVQHLIMFSQFGIKSPYTPASWCQLDRVDGVKKNNVFIVENMSLNHYESNAGSFPFLTGYFTSKLEMLAPKLYGGDCVQELATVPITSTQMIKHRNAHGSIEIAAEKSSDIYNFTKHVFPVSAPISTNTTTNADTFPRTDILLSGWQMVEENYPLPIKGIWETKYPDYVMTKNEYADVTPNSPMFGLDCEMCKTSTGDLELTRISIVNENFKTIYDELVLPHNHIVDYLTPFSGISPQMMKNVTKRLTHVQTEIRRLLPPDAIIVGQSVNNDLHALKMMHPYVIDTSIIFNISGKRSIKSKLKTLCMEFLAERIQDDRSGHCSTEDSIASLKLAKLKLSKDIYFGDAVMSNFNIQSPVTRKPTDLGPTLYATSMLRQITNKEKRAFVVGIDDLASKYSYFTYKQEKLLHSSGILIKRALDNDSVVQKMVNKAKWELIVGHIKVKESDLQNTQRTFADIDEWIKLIYNQSDAPALNIVIFAGGCENGNGCCFINMKT